MNSHDRRGLTLVEVVFALVLGLVVLGVVLMAVPRSRETARLASCRRNLMLIGQALAYYDGNMGHLPTVPQIGHPGTAPLPTMLGQLGLGGLSPLADPRWKPSGRRLDAVPEHFVGEFTCPSDPNILAGRFPAPVSYRVNTGGNAEGTDGPFSPGSVVSLANVEAADGQDFTAGFAERLVGSGPGEPSARNDYRVGNGPWRTDAGSSWAGTGWSTTLYNHSIVPDFTASTISQDGRSAKMGASSGHSQSVHVLLLGGSVRSFTPTVDPDVWRRFGTIKDGVSPAPEP